MRVQPCADIHIGWHSPVAKICNIALAFCEPLAFLFPPFKVHRYLKLPERIQHIDTIALYVYTSAPLWTTAVSMTYSEVPHTCAYQIGNWTEVPQIN
ncbi:hypothetical protein ACH3XW_44485 [Acanthocheilonema viteae]